MREREREDDIRRAHEMEIEGRRHQGRPKHNRRAQSGKISNLVLSVKGMHRIRCRSLVEALTSWAGQSGDRWGFEKEKYFSPGYCTIRLLIYICSYRSGTLLDLYSTAKRAKKRRTLSILTSILTSRPCKMSEQIVLHYMSGTLGRVLFDVQLGLERSMTYWNL